MQIPSDGSQPVGFAYGPPAVPFASYTTYHGALYQLMPAQHPLRHPGHSSSPHAQPGSPHAFPANMLVAVSPKAGSPHVLYHPPVMEGVPRPMWGHPMGPPPHSGQETPRPPAGAPGPPPGGAIYPQEPQHAHVRRRSHLGQSQSRASSPDLPSPYQGDGPPAPPGGPVWWHGRPGTLHAPAFAGQVRPVSPQQHSKFPVQQQQQSQSQQQVPVDAMPEALGPDGLPLKLNAR